MSFADARPEVEHVRARLIELQADGGLIQTSSEQQTLIPGDITVLATQATLGRNSGVTHYPSPIGVVRASWVNRKVKATHMLVLKFRKVFGL
ncbi:MAG TPA: hypothetical protein VLJ57_12570 [Burkholderiaceae bacterium]|nr:hypothetical protein [Burkholderiaceae bacterium]